MAIIPGNTGVAASFPDGFLVGDGTVTAPTFRFQDTQTGFYRPGANQIALASNGVQSLLVSATGLVTFNSGFSLNGGSAANLSIWSASNVLRQRGGTSGWAVDNTSGNAILSATDAGAFNFPVATTHVFGSISGSSPTGIRVDAASSIERTIFITQAGTARLGLLANTSNELFLLSNNQTLRFSTDAGTTTHASINTSGLFSINNGLSVTGTTTLPATVNYTSAGSIVKSGAGALTLSNANASTLSIPTAGTYTFPTAIGTLIGSGDTGTVSNTMLAGSISDTKLSTITTAGKVSNSATTATSANTANAIVARDASGNFSAGTITASVFAMGSSTARTIGQIGYIVSSSGVHSSTLSNGVNSLRSIAITAGTWMVFGGFRPNLTDWGTNQEVSVFVNADNGATAGTGGLPYDSSAWDGSSPGAVIGVNNVGVKVSIVFHTASDVTLYLKSYLAIGGGTAPYSGSSYIAAVRIA